MYRYAYRHAATVIAAHLTILTILTAVAVCVGLALGGGA